MSKTEAAFVYLLLSGMSGALADQTASSGSRAIWLIAGICLAVAGMERDLGVYPPRPSAVRYLLDIYEAPAQDYAYLLQLARTLHQRSRS